MRERLNNRTDRAPSAGDIRRESPRTITGQTRQNTEVRSTRQLNTNPGTERQPSVERQPRIERIETPRNPRSDVQRQETPRYERQQPQRIERSETIQRIERNDRPQQMESGGQRMERFRDSAPRESRSFDRGEIRGVRER